MTKMALRTLFLRADHIDTPLEEGIETFIGVLFIIGPITFDKNF